MNYKKTTKISPLKNSAIFSCFTTDTEPLNLLNNIEKKSKTPKKLFSTYIKKILNEKKNLSESAKIINIINLNKINQKPSIQSEKNKFGFKSIKLFKRDFIDNNFDEIKFQNENNGEIIKFPLFKDNDVFNNGELYYEKLKLNKKDEDQLSDDEKILSGRMYQFKEIGMAIKQKLEK